VAEEAIYYPRFFWSTSVSCTWSAGHARVSIVDTVYSLLYVRMKEERCMNN
jgi:hypothetical protein